MMGFHHYIGKIVSKVGLLAVLGICCTSSLNGVSLCPFKKKKLKGLKPSLLQPPGMRHYHLHRVRDPIIIVGGGLIAGYGLIRQRQQEPLSIDRVFRLSSMNINAFDRPVVNQERTHLALAKKRSDIFLGVSLGMVSLLALDKTVRSEWKEGLTM